MNSKYVELHCKTNFSFLEGASHADELVEQAHRMGYSGIAITDRNSLAGVVRAFAAARDLQFPMITGAELHPIDGPPMVVWASDRSSYARLCRLLTIGRLRREKGACQLSWHDIAQHSDGLLAGMLLRQAEPETEQEATARAAFARELQDAALKEDADILPPDFDQVASASPWDARQLPPEFLNQSGNYNSGSGNDLKSSASIILPAGCFDSRDDDPWLQWLGLFREIFGDRGYLMTELLRGVDDASKLLRLRGLSQQSGVPLVAGGDVHYHIPQRSILHDTLTAVRFGMTIAEVREQRLNSSQYSLRPLTAIQRIYADVPEAVDRTNEIASRCHFQLDQLRYEYPVELAPDGMRPIDYLKRLTWQGAKKRYPSGVPDRVLQSLKHEIGLIEELKYEAYFLTVWDLVRFARSRNILCQGRGSAANSSVCFCLGVTSVDPNQVDLLFERFISRERNEAPDIDVDFEHQRREEVLQYIYEKYGRHRSGMTGVVITYRIKSAIRDCGKALGISLDRLDELTKLVDSRSSDITLPDSCRAVGLDPESDIGKRFVYLVQTLIGFPRHLSQHVGGMVMTQGWLCELCPIENASMDGRTVIQWDKDDLDELGILKVDCLSLGMLSAIHRAFDMISKHYQHDLTLATVPQKDAKVYDMICAADTVGVFQIESRAQMSMLPRLKPRCFYDLVIEVAIVRPGPIQGNMVHPYLKARNEGRQPDYPTDAIRQVLEKTMGVPIFQEQAMRLAVVAAGFTPGEADQLRRAMAAWRRPGVIDRFRQKLIVGMRANNLSEEFAENVFRQIRGFGEYGFPESHAASFALLVYVSAWIKYHYPAVFCASILNSQPMGFYSPSQLVADARQHGVHVARVDVNHSTWDCLLEPLAGTVQRKPGGRVDRREYQLRLGLRMIRGLPEAIAQQIVAARQASGPFADLSDFTRRTRLGQAWLSRLADAGAMNSLSGDRRAAYWQSLAQEKSPRDLPLFESAGVDHDEELPELLTPMAPIEEVYADYQTIGLSLRGHPMEFARPELAKLKVTTAAELKNVRDGRFLRVAGLVVLRQRPGTAKGITFVTLEDETGSINLVIKPDVWKRHYQVARQSNAWLVYGVLECREKVTHVVVARIEDLSTLAPGLVNKSRDFQ